VHGVLWRWLVFAAALAAILVRLLRRGGRRADTGSPWRIAVARVRRSRVAMIALVVLGALVALAVLAAVLAPYDPSAQPDPILLKNRPPSFAHPFGTDIYSRDVLSRVLFGAQVSLMTGLLSVLVSISVGTAWGSIAGYLGGRVDAVMMRIIDACLSIPRILLLIVVISLWETLPLGALILLLGLTGWFGVSRIVRAEVMAVTAHEFVVSARALGADGVRLLVRHVLPNVISPLVVAATLGIGNVIILEAGLSYLGIGVQQPTASWGNIIQDGADQVASLWWISLFPGLAIVVTVMAFNTLGDALRDALDPRQLDAPAAPS
jgi:peptide/nickel transport system permease protein